MSSLLQTARRALAKTKPTSAATTTAAVPAVDSEPGPASARPRVALEPSPITPRVGLEARKTPGEPNAESPAADGGPLTRRTTPATCGWCDGVLAPHLLPLAGRGLALLCTGCHRWTMIGGTA